ncbi:MAG: hypothetical protein L6R42_009198 [Xanthoria sp. 1 TBL-2021]|nr:MAG: hypothetical protein L6R42_009198 [Xanthoria sp. 1 TBL-2021]
MARPPKARNGKRLPPSATKPPPTNPSSENAKPPSTSPFTTPSQPLKTLLSTFPTSHIYILHLDPTPPSHRQQIFLVPLLFNTLLLALLSYRLYTALPAYLALFASILGYTSPASINLSSTPLADVFSIIVKRMATFTFDGLILGRYVAEWPIMFFWGGGSGAKNDDTGTGCMGWRIRIGFPPARREVVVRRSRRWAYNMSAVSHSLLENSEKGSGIEGEGKEKEMIKAAVTKSRLRSKSGLSLVDRDWDLHYTGMVEAHALLSDSESGLEWEELEKGGPVVCVFHGAKDEWMIWRPWGDDEQKLAEEDEGGSKFRRFKDLLTAMGREGLFFRWVEVMQYETSIEGTFTEERREKVIQVSRELFEGQGVSWDEVIDGIGGLDGLPGMEVTS